MRGLERRSLAAFVQARRGVGGVENWQAFETLYAFLAVYYDCAAPAACYASVSGR